jgi:hypothetical protein
MKNHMPSLALAALVLWLCSCASSSIKQTWKSPAYQGGPVQKVAVLAVADRGDVRVGLENRFVHELRRGGQEAVATGDLVGLSEITADKDAAAARMRDAGADAVLVVRLVDQATYSHQTVAVPAFYSPGVSGYDSYSWYDCFSFGTGMAVVRSSSNRYYYLDSSLFDLKTGRRLWSSLTRTVLAEDADALAVADAFTAKNVKALRKDKLVR